MRPEDLVMTDGRLSFNKIFPIVVTFFVIVFAIVNIFNLWERNSSGIYQTQQAWWSGKITTRTEPGFYYQGLALLTDFKAASSYKFTDKPGAENISGPSVKVRFNDGGRAEVNGDARFVLPPNDTDMKNIKLIFDDQATLQNELYSQIVKEALVMSAALMNSEESISLRNQFSELARDQIVNGIYIIEKKSRMVPSEDNPKKMVKQEYVDIKKEIVDGVEVPVRKEKVLTTYNIALQQFVVEDIKYLDGLDGLIDKKRKFLNDIIVAKSATEKAKQEKKTAKSQGEKDEATAEYAKLKEKKEFILALEKDQAKAIIDAKKMLAIAIENEAKAANYKKERTAKADGTAKARALALKADGALVMKKKYYQLAWDAYQDALSQARLVSEATTASQASNNSNGLPAGGLSLLFAVEEQLRAELGLDLNFGNSFN